jgi:hypothetical protein
MPINWLSKVEKKSNDCTTDPEQTPFHCEKSQIAVESISESGYLLDSTTP